MVKLTAEEGQEISQTMEAFFESRGDYIHVWVGDVLVRCLMGPYQKEGLEILAKEREREEISCQHQ